MRIRVLLFVVAALIAPQAALALDPGKVPPITLGTGSSGDASAVSVTPSVAALPGTLARALADQAASLAGKAPLASPVFTGVPSMPALTLTGSGSTAQSMSFGGNRGDVFYGLQIGGGVAEDGSAGIINRLEGHATWQGLFPSRDLSTAEFAIHPTVATGQATSGSSTNQLTYVAGQGRPFNSAWVGRKIYFNGTVLRIASVSGAVATVTNNDGSAYTFPSAVTEMYTVGYVYGTGTANISGTTVTRVSGDPFLPYVSGPNGAAFEFRINGVTRAVSAFTDTKTVTLASAPGNATNVTYEFFWDANDQITTFRLHGSEADAENFTMAMRYDGTWLERQYGHYGKYRPIRMSTGELSYSPGSKIQQLVVRPTGDISLGGDYGWDVLRIPGQSIQRDSFFLMQPGVAGGPVTLAARGNNASAGMNLDMQGGGGLQVSNNGQAQRTFEVFGTTATGQNWLAAYAFTTPAIQAQGAGANVAAAILGKGNSGALTGAFVRAADPTTSDIQPNLCADWQNTTAGTFKHVCNFGGTLRSVTMN